MAAEIVINKVVITDEARFDYECLFNQPIPKNDIKRETEEYIDGRADRINGFYFRIKYFDETTDEMLMLFFYKGKRFGKMQLWELSGVCRAEEWTRELEDDGQIRLWLKSSLDPQETTDWVWDLRIREAEQRRLIEEEYGKDGNDTMAAIKELLKNYKLNKAKAAVGGTVESKRLKEDMEFLDVCIAALDDEAKAIIRGLYIDGQSMSKLGNRFGYCKAAIYKKRNRAVQMLEILFAARV